MRAHTFLPSNPTSSCTSLALPVSLLVQISVPQERVLQLRLSRAWPFSRATHHSKCRFRSEAQARRGEEPDVDPEQFQDPDNEYGLFAGTTYEADDEEADKIYEHVDRTMDSRRRARREAREEAELAKHRAERPKLQQQFADLKRGLAVVSDSEWENIPEVGNLTRRKRRRDERTFAVPDSIIVGDRAKGEYENALDQRQQVRA